VFHRPHVVHDLGHVTRCVRVIQARFSREQILKGTLCPFDLAREHSLFADIHEDEQVRVGQRENRPIKATQRVVGGRQRDPKVAGQIKGWSAAMTPIVNVAFTIRSVPRPSSTFVALAESDSVQVRVDGGGQSFRLDR